MKEKIGILDCDSMLYSAFLDKKVIDEQTGEPLKIDGKFVYIPKTDKEIEETLDGIMYNIFQEGEFTHYIAFVKGNNTIGDRLIINPNYKQQRSKEIPEKWEFTKQYAISKWNAIEVNGLEVDDAVRITNINISNSHVVSIDKDLLWLAGENFNWRKNEWNSVNNQQEEEYLSRSLVCGDGVDNLHGIYGKGPAYCDKNNIKFVWDAFKAYIIELGLEAGVDEFYKNFKCLYILKESNKFEIPASIKINKNEDETTTYPSRSTSGRLPNP